MGIEKVKRIAIKKDGVYLTTKSSNDSAPYRSVRIDSLSEIYKAGGDHALDAELIGMFRDYAEPCGSHPSVMRFRQLWNLVQTQKLLREFREAENAEWLALPEAARKTYSGKEYEAYWKKHQERKAELHNTLASLLPPRSSQKSKGTFPVTGQM